MFDEDLALFTDAASGFAVNATLQGVALQVIFDAPGADALGGEVVTTEPSALITADADPDVADSLVITSGSLPAYLIHLAGTYTVRSLQPEPPDGAFVRCYLVKVA